MDIHKKVIIIELLENRGYKYRHHSLLQSLEFYRKVEGYNCELRIQTDSSNGRKLIVVEVLTDGKRFSHIANNFNELINLLESIT